MLGTPGILITLCSSVDVASAKELKAIKREVGEDFIVLTPGIRPIWSATNDQQRIATPSSAIADGADFIVLGRAVTSADDKALAEQLVKDIPTDACVLAYNKGFECGRIKELATLFPDLADSLMKIRANIKDL